MYVIAIGRTFWKMTNQTAATSMHMMHCFDRFLDTNQPGVSQLP